MSWIFWDTHAGRSQPPWKITMLEWPGVFALVDSPLTFHLTVSNTASYVREPPWPPRPVEFLNDSSPTQHLTSTEGSPAQPHRALLE